MYLFANRSGCTLFTFNYLMSRWLCVLYESLYILYYIGRRTHRKGSSTSGSARFAYIHIMVWQALMFSEEPTKGVPKSNGSNAGVVQSLLLVLLISCQKLLAHWKKVAASRWDFRILFSCYTNLRRTTFMSSCNSVSRDKEILQSGISLQGKQRGETKTILSHKSATLLRSEASTKREELLLLKMYTFTIKCVPKHVTTPLLYTIIIKIVLI